MLDIILLIALCAAVGRVLRAKGRSPGAYQFLAVVLWLVGKVMGRLAGMALELDDGFLLGWVGAACGAGTALAIATLVTPVRTYDADVGRVFD